MRKNKETFCEKCKSQIPKDEVAYRNGEIICQDCWYKKHNSRDTVAEYLRRLKE